MSENQSSYRQMMKATSIFGGVQVLNIIIAFIRSKVVAVLLGPSGIGIMSLLQTTVSLVTSATNFGLGISGVRDISEVSISGDQQKIAETVSIFRKLAWLTGILGIAVTAALSPILSKLTFGNYDYTLAFILISITLLFNQLATGQLVLLQGFRQIRWLAKANVYASVFGLLVSVPLYYFFGNEGIVPAIILTSLSLLAVQYWFANKLNINSIAFTFKEALNKGKGMLKLGFLLSMSGLITVAASYIIRVFISNTGGVEQVGFYNAGFVIMGTYVGMIFTAMGTDYYPRLSSVSHDNTETKKMINQQSELTILVIAPVLIVFLIFIKWIIVILYTEQFKPINSMLLWMALGMIFKAGSWAVGYVLPAKGDGKTFFYSELVANTYLLLLNLGGYYYYGLEGLGISFLIGYILVYLQIYFITSYKYKFRFSFHFYKIVIVQLLLATIAFILSRNFEDMALYIPGIGVLLISMAISLYLLNKKLNFFPFNKKHADK